MPLLYGTHSRWYIGNSDPASDPVNRVRDGKGWVKTTSDNIPWGGILGIFLRSSGSWEPFPFGGGSAPLQLSSIPTALKGDDGDDGWPGPPGRQGDQGVAGVDGVIGRDGRPGMDGQDGDDSYWPVPGPQGVPGAAGSNGADGVGIQGPMGMRGWDGDDGDDGRPGPPGATVSTLLFDQTLTSDTATIDATGIPPGFNVLEIFVYGRTDEVTAGSTAYMQFNGDTGANYTRSFKGVSGTSTDSAGASTADTSLQYVLPGTSFTSNTFGVWTFRCPFYAGATNFKVLDTTGGASDTTSSRNFAYVLQATWRSANAINRVTTGVVSGGKKLVAGSRMLIYGR